MSLTEFAMVEELAFLVKDNLPCKHLILSMEETLVNFLLDDTSSDGILELEPTNPYNRLLLHRLADIFGFAHQSVGEGEERHLVLERCSDTAIPSILISDLLWQYDELQSPRTVDVIYRRKEDSEGSRVEETPTPIPIFNLSLEEREEAYMAARKRIFSVDQGETRQCTKDRPQKDPTVARRMIAHALGQRTRPANTEQCGEQTKDVNMQHKEERLTNSGKQTCMEVKTPRTKYPGSCGNPRSNKSNGSKSPHMKKSAPKSANETGSSTPVKKDGKVHKDSIRDEHIGAAKRIFANALGFAREGNVK
ncbi:R3H domain-containing protein 2 isoform X1 [Capsicum annuum]|uniref:R3H domain-containing protein 2 isoform X1 n=1 Tax=Capsicum annuum TaxID=4072 RepID=UPI001FB080CA|nr:R3H domain-containing protein 2 isoform X1 [Capsicum annuum]